MVARYLEIKGVGGQNLAVVSLLRYCSHIFS